VRRQIVTSIVVLTGLTIVLGFGYPLVVTGLATMGFSRQAGGSAIYRGHTLIGSSLIGQGFTGGDGRPLLRYFQSRPSSAGAGYDASASAASNLGPTNPLLVGFVAGANSVGLDGRPSPENPFATGADPACVPLDPSGTPVTVPTPGQRYERGPAGAYVCDPDTVPERAIAYRHLNGLAADTPVPVDAVTASGSGVDPGISVTNALDQAPRVARVRHLALPLVVGLIRQDTQERQFGFLGEPSVNVLELNLDLDRLP
jgi:K+-transporting ATPase ATPase C chain